MGYLECGINEESSKMFERPIPTLIEDNEKLERYGLIFLKLQLYASYRDKFFVPLAFKKEYSNISYDKKEKINNYKSDDIDFSFLLLSDVIPDKKEKKKLTTDKRLHVCHEASIGMALNSDDPSIKIIIGYVPCIDQEVLHSILECQISGKKYIIDYTQNIIMNEENYYEINQFRKISEVSSSFLKKDLSIIKKLNLLQPFYLLFREEIMRDLKKNEKILKLED